MERVLYYLYIVRFSPSIEQKQFYNCEATIWVWCGVADKSCLQMLVSKSLTW